MRVRVYFEGGSRADSGALRIAQDAMRTFLDNLRPTLRRRPSIIMCGGRLEAYDKFRNNWRNRGEDLSLLLVVDSESPRHPSGSWRHLAERRGDGWTALEGATDECAFLMVQCMESWFLADKEALRGFYGEKFHVNALAGNPNIEDISKGDVERSLDNATRHCRKGLYSENKGKHSWEILQILDPALVRKASPEADRFFRRLEALLN